LKEPSTNNNLTWRAVSSVGDVNSTRKSANT
jgi:hypothetical protein